MKGYALWSAFIGIAYIIFGLSEVASWIAGVLGKDLQIPVSQDIIAGFVLITIGLILLYRIGDLMKMKYEGLSFLLVGLMLSAIIGGMYILIAGADVLDAAIVGDEWTFDPSAYNLPAIALFILSLPCWLALRRKNKFSQ